MLFAGVSISHFLNWLFCLGNLVILASNVKLHFVKFLANGFYVSSYVHIDLYSGFFGLNCCEKIGKNDFGDGFVENFDVAEVVDIDFERFELQAVLVRNIADLYAAKVWPV